MKAAIVLERISKMSSWRLHLQNGSRDFFNFDSSLAFKHASHTIVEFVFLFICLLEKVSFTKKDRAHCARFLLAQAVRSLQWHGAGTSKII